MRKKKLTIALVLVFMLMAGALYAGSRYVAAARHYNQGVEHHERRLLREAKAEYLAAIAANPWHADAHNELSTVYRDLKDYEKALAHAQKALDLNPESAAYNLNMGFLKYNYLSRTREAIGHFKKVREVDPKNFYAALILGEIYTKNREYDRAIDMFNVAIAINPRVSAGYRGLAKVYTASGMKTQAGLEWLRVLRIDPKDEEARLSVRLTGPTAGK